jgi:phosphoglycolate phosphatase
MAKRTVLFDFDGVIADSFAAALNTAKARCKHRTEEGYRKAFEGNIYDATFERPDHDHTDCDHENDWWNTFTAFFAQEGGMFELMDVVIKKLATDYRLVIVSSSTHDIIAKFLKDHALTDCFEGIYDMQVHNSKSEKIGMIFDKYGIGPNDCVMITDSKGDILEAREKGVESIAVTWGFNSYDVLLSGDPWRIVRLPDELPNAVTEYFKNK